MKTKHAVRKPRPHPLAEQLFNIGMDAWLRVDKNKTRATFDALECAGQRAAWNAIARFVETYAQKCADHDHY